jgi:hypothetical protein
MADPPRSFLGVADGLLHANLVRWVAPPDAELVARLRRHRRARLAPQPLGAIELVETNKVMAEAQTTLLGRWRLAPGEDVASAAVGTEDPSGTDRQR